MELETAVKEGYGDVVFDDVLHSIFREEFR